MAPQKTPPVLSLMLAVPDTPAAIEWYKKALGARVLWSLGSVAGLEIEGAPFFLHETVKNIFNSPIELGTTTARVELFADNPDEIIANALKAGAAGKLEDIQDYQVPWGIHRQGGFTDPFGHRWLVGDKSPLNHFPPIV
jgi:PhnB protein